MLFSLRRKAPKDSLRLPPQTPIHLPGSAYPRLERCCSARGARTGHHSPCGTQLRVGSTRPQAQGCRNALAARSACSAVDCVPLRYANTCREPTRRALGSHERSSRRLAASFRSFLVWTRKEHIPPLQRRIKMSFSHRRENDEKSRRDFCLGLSSCCWQAHTHGSQQTEPRTYVRSPSFAVRRLCATGSSAPAGARRAPYERLPA